MLKKREIIENGFGGPKIKPRGPKLPPYRRAVKACLERKDTQAFIESLRNVLTEAQQQKLLSLLPPTRKKSPKSSPQQGRQLADSEEQKHRGGCAIVRLPSDPSQMMIATYLDSGHGCSFLIATTRDEDPRATFFWKRLRSYR